MASRRAISLAVVALLAGALPSRAASPAFTPDQRGGTLRRLLNSEPQNLNPLTGKDLYERYVNDYVFQQLLELNPDNLEMDGVLAERWEISDDGRIITFHLRPEARFSDGHPLTADDVVFSFNLTVNPEVDCHSMASYLSDCERCEKVDDHTVRFVWKEVYYKTLHSSGWLFPVLPKHVYEPIVRGEGGATRFNDLVKGLVGSGPYTFSEWTTGREIVLVRNENYWDNPPSFDRIVFRVILEEQASIQAFLSGDLDYIAVGPEWWVKLQDHSGRDKAFQMLRYLSPAAGYTFIAWNHAKWRDVVGPDGQVRHVEEPHPIFHDPRVRRAMTQLIWRDQILKYMRHGMGRVATGPFWPEGLRVDPSVEPWPYDRAEALRLLDEAGWKDRDGDGWLEDARGNRFAFEWTIPADSALGRDLARIIKEEFRRVGIDVAVRFLEWSVFVTALDNRSFDAIMLSWGGGFESDPYQIWHSDQIADQGHNFISFRNPEADRLIEAARRTLDRDPRNRLYQRFHSLLHDQQPYTFLWNREVLALVSTRLRGVTLHRAGLEPDEWWVPGEERLDRPGGAP